MNNLQTAQNAWLRADAPQDDPDICMNTKRDCVAVCYPDIGHPGYLVLSLSGSARQFATFGEAMDYATTIA